MSPVTLPSHSLKRSKAPLAEVLKPLAFCGICVFLYAAISIGGAWWNQLKTGENCRLARTTFGVEDLGKDRLDLRNAERAEDEIGLGELIYTNKAALIPQGTYCLILQSDFLKQYRQVRILGGLNFGHALWVESGALEARSKSDLDEIACHDPHAHSYSVSGCLCDEGYELSLTSLTCTKR
jgi:hypothetical protein